AGRLVQVRHALGFLGVGEQVAAIALQHLDLVVAADEKAAVVTLLVGSPLETNDEVRELVLGKQVAAAAVGDQHAVIHLPALQNPVVRLPPLEAFAVEERAKALLLLGLGDHLGRGKGGRQKNGGQRQSLHDFLPQSGGSSGLLLVEVVAVNHVM